jgi:hypothetical protein
MTARAVGADNLHLGAGRFAAATRSPARRPSLPQQGSLDQPRVGQEMVMGTVSLDRESGGILLRIYHHRYPRPTLE